MQKSKMNMSWSFKLTGSNLHIVASSASWPWFYHVSGFTSEFSASAYDTGLDNSVTV